MVVFTGLVSALRIAIDVLWSESRMRRNHGFNLVDLDGNMDGTAIDPVLITCSYGILSE